MLFSLTISASYEFEEGICLINLYYSKTNAKIRNAQISAAKPIDNCVSKDAF